MDVNYIIVPMLLVWSPFFIFYIWCSSGVFFLVLEHLSKSIYKIFDKIHKKLDRYLDYHPKVMSVYLKIAFAVTYAVGAIMVFCVLFGVEIK